MTLYCLIGFIGCAHTNVASWSKDPSFDALSRANLHPLPVLVASLNNEMAVGSQFLFPLFPLGSVHLIDPADSLYLATEELLVLAGFKPYQIANPDRALEYLSVTLDDISLTGYDLFFVRKISCSLKLSLALYGTGGNLLRSAIVNKNFSNFARYAFAPELQRAYRDSLRSALDQGLNDLALTGRQT